MKKTRLACMILSIMIFITACGAGTDLWETAEFAEDTQFGTGTKTVLVTVTAEEKSVKFMVNTDKEILGDALLEHNIIAGEKGAYGLYVKTVNGIYADYEVTKSYWSINKNGEYMMTGVDSEKISGGEEYEFIYTKN